MNSGESNLWNHLFHLACVEPEQQRFSERYYRYPAAQWLNLCPQNSLVVTATHRVKHDILSIPKHGITSGPGGRLAHAERFFTIVLTIAASFHFISERRFQFSTNFRRVFFIFPQRLHAPCASDEHLHCDGRSRGSGGGNVSRTAGCRSNQPTQASAPAPSYFRRKKRTLTRNGSFVLVIRPKS